MKKYVLQYLEQFLAPQKAKLQERAKSLKLKATDAGADLSGQALYQILRIQAIASIFLFLNLLAALLLNLVWRKFFTESYEYLEDLGGFLIVFIFYVLMIAVLARFKPSIIKWLSKWLHPRVERKIDAQVLALGKKVEEFDTENIQLPQTKTTSPPPAVETPVSAPSSSTKTKVKRALIATAAGTATMLAIRFALKQKKKAKTTETPSQTQVKKEPSETQKAITSVVATAGKELALELIRSLTKKEERKKTDQ